ncbi:MAG TPA: hypothetical protein VFB78_05140 [Acidimicrobiales bacterium]|nr:hypothetical protein [Acidimicrobiales bacterium]
MSVAVPVNPDLQELWRARLDPDAPLARRSLGSRVAPFLIWSGLFLLGFGLSGVYQRIPG